MLWTDAVFIKDSDLKRLDSEVDDVAASESDAIDITNDVIPMAISECGTELLMEMQRFGGFLSSGLVSANHLAAVFNVGGPGVNRTRILLGQIVVDNPRVQTVAQWVRYSALVLLYRNAFARTKNDRYKEKMLQYAKDIQQKYKPRMIALGIPVVYRPLACPGAYQERSGTWGAGNVTSVNHAGPTGGSFYVTITYVDQSQYLGPLYGVTSVGGIGAANNGESYTAMPQAATPTAGQVIHIDITSLIPPNGQVDQQQLAMAIVTPYQATGWNVYVGSSVNGPFYIQNASPIPIATKTYSLAGDPVLSGYTPNPQYEEAWYTVQPMLQRG